MYCAKTSENLTSELGVVSPMFQKVFHLVFQMTPQDGQMKQLRRKQLYWQQFSGPAKVFHLVFHLVFQTARQMKRNTSLVRARCGTGTCDTCA
jgi:hypothetical protein